MVIDIIVSADLVGFSDHFCCDRLFWYHNMPFSVRLDESDFVHSCHCWMFSPAGSIRSRPLIPLHTQNVSGWGYRYFDLTCSICPLWKSVRLFIRITNHNAHSFVTVSSPRRIRLLFAHQKSWHLRFISMKFLRKCHAYR